MLQPVMTSPPSEREAVARVRLDGGDHAAFGVVYQAHVGEVLRLLRRLLRPDEVADAAQESFVRLHRGLRQSYDPALPLRPYVLRIARNVALEALRRREKLGKLLPLEGEPSGDAPEPAGVAAAAEQGRLIDEALATLEPEQRSAVVLRYAHGLKLLEVAQALSCSERTVRNRLRAAAVLLERELRRRGVGDEEVSS